MLRRLVYLSFVLVLSAVAAFTAAPARSANDAAAPSLTGEMFNSNNYFFQGGVFNCNPDGNTTFTLVVNGVASGPYPGTFSETATVTIGPQPPGQVGPVTQFDASFTVDSPAGSVSGTKHLETVTSPAAGQCVGFNPNPCVPGLTIAAEIFALDATYAATITTATGTDTDQGLSHVSFQGQQQCGVEAELHTGTFDESFTSSVTSHCNADNVGDRGKGKDRGNHNGAGRARGCRASADGSADDGAADGG
jgi:hypothetical protein